jgi:hypothetical protein
MNSATLPSFCEGYRELDEKTKRGIRKVVYS